MFKRYKLCVDLGTMWTNTRPHSVLYSAGEYTKERNITVYAKKELYVLGGVYALYR